MTTPPAPPRDTAEPLVIYVDRGPIAVVTLNRPDRRNALSRGLVVALTDLLAVLAARPAVRVVVLSGAGTVFC
ncbi:MAG: enoyl-CoA hydratase/isomerase family protein, partial [Planctomycetota bacterium]|nr:enoyl-CoA hydratase/isomerase family protein [Planctomycetota bacterium]